MEAPLRRSTRCRRPTYGTGDVVEITHGSTAGGISIGRLISKIDDDSTAASPATGHDDAEAMWIVSFKESSRIAKDEVVPERAFTRVVKQANPEDDSWKKLLALSSDEHEEEGDTSTTPGAAGATPVSTGNGNGNGNANGSSNSSQGSAARRVGGRKSKRRASAKSASNSTVSPKVSTRASASSEDNVTTVSGYSTRQRSGKAKRKVEPPVTQQRKKRKRQSPVNSQSEEERLQAKEKYHEEVEKIKMNTGILYIYRGHNPRVSFVRKY